MKIKYKLIIAFVLAIIFSSLPLSLFILNKHEKETISSFITKEKTTAKILAQSSLNIILMNGGDIETSRVDAREMIRALKPGYDTGLVFADAIMLKRRGIFGGSVLTTLSKNRSYTDFFYPGKNELISFDEIHRLKNIPEGSHEIHIPELKGSFYEIVALGSMPGQRPFCIGRIVLSKSAILKPITQTRHFVYLVTCLAIAIVSMFGFIMSRLISRPVEKLITGSHMIKSGNFNHRVMINSGDELGTLASTFNRMTDIITEKITELENANIELKRLDKLKDEFLANTSHELRTPITGIIGLAESLKEGIAGELNINAKKNLELIIQSGKRLSSLINDILDYSKLKHSTILLKKTDVDMHSVADIIISILTPLAGIKGLELKNLIESNTCFVHGDEDRIQQVLLNLTENAIKFTESGSVTINTARDPVHADTIVVSVSDTGVGIPEENIGRIFESFEQGDGSTSRSYGGTGLGLAISKDIVELHGGTIWANSIPGHGTVMRFSLPAGTGDAISTMPPDYNFFAAPAQEDNAPVHAHDDTPENRNSISEDRFKVLIIDDEPINLQVLVNHLTLAGYEVITALNGPMGLQCIESSGKPDLILLDIMMPAMSGYEVCRIIRQTHPPYMLPIIMLTAKTSIDDIITGLQAGANDYVSKPFDREELLSRVKNLIELKKSVRAFHDLLILNQELDIANKIQKAILPQEMPRLPGVCIQARYEPMSQVGGDLFDFHVINSSRIGIFIADVTGHGVPAALISAMLKIAFYHSKDLSESPARLMDAINESLWDHIHNRFVTALYLLLDTEQKTVTYSNAAHWPLLIVKKDSPTVDNISSPGKLLGMVRDSGYREHVFSVEKGDRIILYTDGIIEERNKEGAIFGEKRFHSLIQESTDLAADDLITLVFDTIRSWSGSYPHESIEDDMTMVVIDL